MVTLGKTCRTVNGYDVNFMDEYKRNITAVIDDRLDDVSDDMVSGIQKDGRGNIAPITIILPTLAMEARDLVFSKVDKGEIVLDYFYDYCEGEYNNRHRVSEGVGYYAVKDGDYGTINGKFVIYDELRPYFVEEFKTILEKHIRMCKDELLERFKHISSQSFKSAIFMYENNTMAGYHSNQGIQSALKHGTIVIGQLGLSETLYILIDCDQTSDKGMKLAKEIEQIYNDLTAQFKKEYNMNFGVYYTPAESLCHTAFVKWKDTYGDMENVTYYIDEEGVRHDKEYFTNSIHVPVYKKMTPYEKIDIESQLTGYSNAGCITYVEVDGQIVHNIKALEELVDYAMDKDIPYLAINLNNGGDMCEDCGYKGYIPGACHKCGSENISRLRRVCGYLTGNYKQTTDKDGNVIRAGAFNKGKVCETDQRVIHKKEMKFD